LREGLRKGYDDQVIDLLPGQQEDLLGEGVDKPDVMMSAVDDLAGVGEKSDDDRFPADAGGFLSQLPEDVNMTRMNAVKCAYGDDRLPEIGQMVDVSMDLHVAAN